MEAKATTQARVYEDFEPFSQAVRGEDFETLILYLPGFLKEQLRVQLARSNTLIISGERNVQQNIWSRFRKEFQIITDCDVNKISAKFEESVLYIRQPKLITPAPKQEEKPPVTESPKPRGPTDEPTPQKAQEQVLGEPKERSVETAQKTEAKTHETDGKVEEERRDEDKGTTDMKNGKQTLTESTVDEKLEAEETKSGKTAQENYSKAFGGFAKKLSMPRKAMNAVLVLLMALVLGIYVLNAFRSWSSTRDANEHTSSYGEL